MDAGSLGLDRERDECVAWSLVATFDLVGAESKRPFYGDLTANLTYALEATTLVGTGGFAEVEVGPDEVGEALVEIGGTAKGCDLNWGWPSGLNDTDTIRVPVKRGYTTYAAVTCD